MKWTQACLFTNSFSIIVNDSLTLDYPTHRGLCQGNPLSPILFLLVEEDMTRMVHKETQME